jgi:hypothetical protein
VRDTSVEESDRKVYLITPGNALVTARLGSQKPCKCGDFGGKPWFSRVSTIPLNLSN